MTATKKTTTAGADSAPAAPRTRRAPAKKTTAGKATTPPADVAPELVLADPATLVVGANVRLDPRLKADFIDSIRERGVLEPIIAYRDGDGRLVVLRGQRRTVAAVQVGRATVPVVVLAEPDDVDRLVDQLAENDHRDGLESGERAAAFTQLAAFGLPAGDIARRTAHRREVVDRALAVAASARVQEMQAKHPTLSFDHLSAVAEFEDDPRAIEALDQAAEKGSGFAHVAQSLRDTRDQRLAVLAAERALADAGVKVVEKLTNRPKAHRLDRLKGDAGGTPMTEQEHAGCPGHAAHLEEEWLYPGDDGYPADRVVDGDPDDEDAAVYAAVPVYLCLDWAANGHEERFPSHSGSSTPAAEKDDAERAAASAERRRVIAGNKAWDSAQTVRRAWLRELLQRKAAPARAAAFVAGSLARRDHAVQSALMNGIDLIREILGLEAEGQSYGDYEGYQRRRRELVDMIDGASDGRALLLSLGVVLAAYEQSADRNSWRRTLREGGTGYDGLVDPTVRYLRYLEAIGYELSTIELQACGVAPEPEADPEPEPVDQGLLEVVGQS